MSDSEFSFFGVEYMKYYTVHVHGYLSVFVCAFGSIANVFNMILFTRKHMISPINTILWFLALVDLIFLLFYLPEAWYFYLRPNSDPYENLLFYTYEWALFMLWRFHIGNIFFNTSVWLTALVSLWRYIAIVYPLKNRIWCNMRNILKTVALMFLLCVLLEVPAFFTNTILPITEYNFTVYVLSYDRSNPLPSYMENVEYIFSVFCVLLPAFFMTALSVKLFLAFSKIKESREHLNAETNSNAAYTRNEKQMTRTTLILITLSVVCLITYLPRTILGLSFFFLDEWVHIEYWNVLIELITIPALINSAISFFIYYTIGEQFRETFKALFGIKSTQEASIRMRQNRTSSDDCVI